MNQQSLLLANFLYQEFSTPVGTSPFLGAVITNRNGKPDSLTCQPVWFNISFLQFTHDRLCPLLRESQIVCLSANFVGMTNHLHGDGWIHFHKLSHLIQLRLRRRLQHPRIGLEENILQCGT